MSQAKCANVGAWTIGFDLDEHGTLTICVMEERMDATWVDAFHRHIRVQPNCQTENHVDCQSPKNCACHCHKEKA